MAALRGWVGGTEVLVVAVLDWGFVFRHFFDFQSEQPAH